MAGLATSEIERVFREEHVRAVSVLVRICGDIDTGERSICESTQATSSVCTGFQFYQLTTKKNLLTDVPFLRTRRQSCKALQWLRQPFFIAFDKSPRLRNRTTPRNRRPRRSIRTQPQHVTTRTRIGDEPHRHA